MKWKFWKKGEEPEDVEVQLVKANYLTFPANHIYIECDREYFDWFVQESGVNAIVEYNGSYYCMTDSTICATVLEGD